MLPNEYIPYGTAEAIVEERIRKAEARRRISRAMNHRRVRDRFRRSIEQGLRNGLGLSDLRAELRTVLRAAGRLQWEMNTYALSRVVLRGEHSRDGG